MAGAFETGVYRNVFMECGIPEEEIEKKVSDTFRTMFYGKEEERIYHEAGQTAASSPIPETTTCARKACPTV